MVAIRLVHKGREAGFSGAMGRSERWLQKKRARAAAHNAAVASWASSRARSRHASVSYSFRGGFFRVHAAVIGGAAVSGGFVGSGLGWRDASAAVFGGVDVLIVSMYQRPGCMLLLSAALLFFGG